MGDEVIENLGQLASTWERDKGIDVSRIKGKKSKQNTVNAQYFEPPGAVNNGPPKLTVYLTQA